ncbi:MAG TPA: 4-hydroxy-tetrahydrodipicolinate synthase [Bryobacteraceae bacterium]|nr:4-hydroxy-tetrahydrodipicolinate synthase [Bryobacteraceae bacterium]
MRTFKGCGTALVTPFRSDGSLDESTLRSLIRRQIEDGVHFLVPCGTTGESPTLSHEEHLRVVEIAVEEGKGTTPVLAGAGGYNTAEVIELAKAVQSLGADGILSVTPYYNKPTQEGLYLHYRAIAEAIDIPIVVYSVAARTGVNVEPATLKRLTEIDNIVAVKEASGMLGQMTRIRALTPNLTLLSGDDLLTSAVLGIGGEGVISVASNVVPKEMSQLAETNDFAITQRLLALMDALFIESNPIPVKAAMAMMGLLEPVWRLPLCAPQPSTEAKLRQVLSELGLVNA